MFKNQVRKRLSKFNSKFNFIQIYTYLGKKCVCKVITTCGSVHSNFLNNKLFSNKNKVLEVEE